MDSHREKRAAAPLGLFSQKKNWELLPQRVTQK